MGPEFLAPRSLDEAVRLVDAESLVLAGGTQLAPRLRDGRVRARRLVWLGRVEGLDTVLPTPHGGVVVGATATLGCLARSPLLVGGLACLAEAAATVGNPRVRARATVGGGVVHADPRQDVPAAMFALGTRVRLRGRGGSRELPFAHLWGGDGVGLGDRELVAAFVVPPPGGATSSHLRFTPASRHDYPTVAASAQVDTGPDGRVARAMVGLAGGGPAPLAVDVVALLSHATPAQLLAGHGDRIPRGGALAEAAQLVAAMTAPVGDRHGSADFKRAMAGVWARRALHHALSRLVDDSGG